jgi:hypothetical protein
MGKIMGKPRELPRLRDENAEIPVPQAFSAIPRIENKWEKIARKWETRQKKWENSIPLIRGQGPRSHFRRRDRGRSEDAGHQVQGSA